MATTVIGGGTFTVVVADGNVASSDIDDAGTSRLHISRAPGTFGGPILTDVVRR